MNRPVVLYIIMLVTVLSSCQKSAFLSAKPSSSLVVPNTLADFQALLDADRMNQTPSIGEASADNYVITDSDLLASLATKDRNVYTWAADIYEGQGADLDWNIPYQNILYCNVVLEGLDKAGRNNTSAAQWDYIKGQAYFHRAYHFYQLAQAFAAPYDSSTALTDLGVPLRLASDVSASVPRASVEATYEQIIHDLHASIPLLQGHQPDDHRNRASAPAAYGMMARVYLAMNEYNKAYVAADTALSLYDVLIDYNTITATNNTPFTRLNPEVIFQSKFYDGEPVLYKIRFQVRGIAVDSTLYDSYDSNDLRKKYFFVLKPTGIFSKSGYSGETSAFTGIATDELLLIRAEAAARMQRTDLALADLNSLLRQRYRSGTFTDIATANADSVLQRVLTERRKELIWRNARWTDLRRLNLLGAQITLYRHVNGQTITLAPNSPRYTLPIPPDAIALGNYPQNER